MELRDTPESKADEKVRDTNELWNRRECSKIRKESGSISNERDSVNQIYHTF